MKMEVARSAVGHLWIIRLTNQPRCPNRIAIPDNWGLVQGDTHNPAGWNENYGPSPVTVEKSAGGGRTPEIHKPSDLLAHATFHVSH